MRLHEETVKIKDRGKVHSTKQKTRGLVRWSQELIGDFGVKMRELNQEERTCEYCEESLVAGDCVCG